MTSYNERPQAATSTTDTLTILTSRGPLLTKRWRADGVIQATDKARHYRVQTTTVDGIQALHRVLVALYDQPTRAVIRGTYTGDPAAARAGEATRTMEVFADQALHAHMMDVDRFECLVADPLDDPAAAVREYVLTLPPEYRVASYSWALSPSAGHPSKPPHELRAHVWFWASVPRTSAERQAWAVVNSVPTDKAVLHPVQLHYTAGPVLDDGVVDPLAGRRVGYHQGEQDVVDVVWDAPAIAVQLATGGRRVSGTAGADGQEYPDPRAKRGLVGAFCRAFAPEDVLTAPWFPEPMEPVPGSARRWTWAAPGHPPEGCFITDDGQYFVNTHDSAPAGTIRKGLNSYDLARVYVYGHLDEGVPEDDQWAWAVDPTSRPSDAAMRAWARQLPEVQRELEAERASRTMDDDPMPTPTLEAPQNAQPPKVRDMTERHGAEALDKIRFVLGAEGLTEDEVAACINTGAVASNWRGVFYVAKESRVYFLNASDFLVNFPATEWQNQAALVFGHILDRDAVLAAAQRIAAGRGANVSPDPIADQIHKAAWGMFTKYVKHYRQRQAVEYGTDMFNERGLISIEQSSARVVLGFKPFKLPELVDAAKAAWVLKEYKGHFPGFDDLLDMLLHARFASDRRKAFLWMQIQSSGGKGFLGSGVLGDQGLGIVCELSSKEIEAALEGKPAGVSAEMIWRAWVIWVDEFKSAKGELKLLNSSFTAAPKNQLKFKVPIYTKLFTSAEGVDSLAGADGVEAQFAERFSLINASNGRMDDLPVFKQVGKAVYLQVVQRYAAERLNAGVARMQELGPVESSKLADEWLDNFHAKHGLDNSFDRLETNVDGWADEIRKLIRNYGRRSIGLDAPRSLDGLSSGVKQAIASNVSVIRAVRSKKVAASEAPYVAIVRRPVALVKAWIAASIQPSQVTMVMHKANAIAESLAGHKLSDKQRWYEVDDNGEMAEETGKALVIDVEATRSDFDQSNVIRADFGKD